MYNRELIPGAAAGLRDCRVTSHIVTRPSVEKRSHATGIYEQVETNVGSVQEYSIKAEKQETAFAQQLGCFYLTPERICIKHSSSLRNKIYILSFLITFH